MRCIARAFGVTLWFIVLAASPAHADAGWFEAGDSLLRSDLVLLNDAGIIRLPVAQWPLPKEAVRFALLNAKEHFASNSAVILALARVHARMADPKHDDRGLELAGSLAAGHAGRLRDFDTLGREDAELHARAGFGTARAAAGLNVTAVVEPSDGKSLRLDGSHATLQLGNWLVSANTLDRWWGPGHEGSLILSSNARPMPTLMVERAAAKPFETPLLSWLGPWRFNVAVSRMEENRQDIDAPLFLAMRVDFMPFRKMELGFSRTAQFCGKQQACDLSTLGELFIGNDNAGIDASLENEPGNQMAGFDVRWNSPIGDLPYALYAQLIGEDESGYLPVKYLALFGAEVWKPLVRGGMVQGYFEYADNTCSADRNPPRFNCAYIQRQFDVEGYRYRGRSIGHTADNDAEMYALGTTYATEGGELWSAVARYGRLNRGGAAPDVRNTVSAVPADYLAAEIGWHRKLLGGQAAIELGAEAYQADGADRQVDAFGFVTWRREFGE